MYSIYSRAWDHLRTQLKQIWLITLVLILAACGGGTTETGLVSNRINFEQQNPEFAPKFESKLKQLFDQYQIQGDILFALVNEEGLAYSYVLNEEQLSGKPGTLNAESPFYIASHTKAFTGTLLKSLEEDQLIDLDRSLHDYLPELKFDGTLDTKQIMLRQLLNHTHGIHSTSLTWKTAFLGYAGGDQELIHDLNTDFRFDPSHRFRYSNTGPIIAGIIVDKVLGHSWKKELRSRIFEPLGMTHTSAFVSDFDRGSILPALKVSSQGQVLRSGFYKDDVTMHAAGGIISNLNDLSRWLQANIIGDERVLGRRSDWAAMHDLSAPQERTYFTYQRWGYSLGWDLATYQNDTLLTRFGSYAGSSFHASFLPGKQLGVIAFSNDSRIAYLPHLFANYAYNLVNRFHEADSIFSEEQALFMAGYEKALSRPLAAELETLIPNEAHPLPLGLYKNEQGWPTIEVSRSGGEFTLRWGVLSGPIYLAPDPEQPYVADLGALERSFSVRGDSLFTGSLGYLRQAE